MGRSCARRCIAAILRHASNICKQCRQLILEASWLALSCIGSSGSCISLNSGASQVLNGLSMGMSALQLAAKMCRPDLLTLLLDARADLDVRDRTQWTALHFAARADPHAHCTDCARLLLQRGADAFAATDLGSAALFSFRSLDKRRCESCESGVLAQFCSRSTPLELARRSGCTACVRLLESHASLWQGRTCSTALQAQVTKEP